MSIENPFEVNNIAENKIEKLEKPPVLYHASAATDIKEVIPQRKTARRDDEGPVVFGAKDLAFATMFIVRADDSWTLKGIHGGVYYTVISDEERFRNLDKGGPVYELPNDSFECDRNIGMREYEWQSKDPVKPLAEKNYPSGLGAMIENGVQVYFVDKDTLEKIRETKWKNLEILRGLQSENQKLNKNVIEF